MTKAIIENALLRTLRLFHTTAAEERKARRRYDVLNIFAEKDHLCLLTTNGRVMGVAKADYLGPLDEPFECSVPAAILGASWLTAKREPRSWMEIGPPDDHGVRNVTLSPTSINVSVSMRTVYKHCPVSYKSIVAKWPDEIFTPPSQLDVKYLTLIGKAESLLRQKSSSPLSVRIKHNGKNPAFVIFGRDDFFLAVAPLDCDLETIQLPEWAKAPSAPREKTEEKEAVSYAY